MCNIYLTYSGWFTGTFNWHVSICFSFTRNRHFSVLPLVEEEEQEEESHKKHYFKSLDLSPFSCCRTPDVTGWGCWVPVGWGWLDSSSIGAERGHQQRIPLKTGWVKKILFKFELGLKWDFMTHTGRSALKFWVDGLVCAYVVSLKLLENCCCHHFHYTGSVFCCT